MTDRASRAGLGGIDLVVHEGVLREKRYWQTIAEAREPLPMLLFCPACGHQHIDAPEPERDWTNPPHRSHLCSECGCIWRPADIATTGVERIRTQGKVDTWSVEDGAVVAATPAQEEKPPLQYSLQGRYMSRCQADDDGYCDFAQCPQMRDGEPHNTGRHCPLDREGREA